MIGAAALAGTWASSGRRRSAKVILQVAGVGGEAFRHLGPVGGMCVLDPNGGLKL